MAVEPQATPRPRERSAGFWIQTASGSHVFARSQASAASTAFGSLLSSRAEIVPAAFGNDAGIVGAAMAAVQLER